MLKALTSGLGLGQNQHTIIKSSNMDSLKLPIKIETMQLCNLKNPNPKSSKH